MRFHFVGLILSGMVLYSCVDGAKRMPQTTLDYKKIDTTNVDSTINIIVEIPAGTTAKYEMNKDTYRLEIDSVDGRPRDINYLGYPGNYGMIPKTLLAKNIGGDGDPLDVLLLGKSIERGEVVKGQVVGVLNLLDNGEQDDKIIAVPKTGQWTKVNSLQDLDDLYPGAKDIVSTFFTNYKGRGQMKFEGWGDKDQAWSIIDLSKKSSYNSLEVDK